MKRFLLFLTFMIPLMGFMRAGEVVDVIERSNISDYPSAYASDPGTYTSDNGITYKVNAAANNNCIQINSGTGKGGIVVSSNQYGYTVKKIEVEFLSSETSKDLKVFLNSTPYNYTTSSSFVATPAGTALSSLISPTNKSIEIEDGKPYWAIKATGGSYITKITVTYDDGKGNETDPPVEGGVTYPDVDNGVIFLSSKASYEGSLKDFRYDITSDITPAEGVCTLTFEDPQLSDDKIVFQKDKSITVTPLEGITITKIYWNQTKEETRADANSVDLLNKSKGIILGDETTAYWSGDVTFPESISFNSPNGDIYSDYIIVEYAKNSTSGEEEEMENKSVTFDFLDSTYGMGPGTVNTANDDYLSSSQNIATYKDVKIEFGWPSDKSNAWRFYTDGLRAHYKQNPYFIVSAPGYTITSIDIETTSKFALDGTNTEITHWDGSAEEVKFNCIHTSSNNPVKKITVTYESTSTGGGDDGPTPGETVDYEAPFDGEAYTIYLDDSLNPTDGADYPSTMTWTVTYASTGNKLEYSDKEFKFKGIAVGDATVHAEWTQDDKYKAGQADFTVSVRPRPMDDPKTAEGEINASPVTVNFENANYGLTRKSDNDNYSPDPTYISKNPFKFKIEGETSLWQDGLKFLKAGGAFTISSFSPEYQIKKITASFDGSTTAKQFNLAKDCDGVFYNDGQYDFWEGASNEVKIELVKAGGSCKLKYIKVEYEKVEVPAEKGTKDNPYTAGEIAAMTTDLDSKIWVEGYIVGTMVNNNLSTSLANAAATNLVLANSKDETNAIVPVELPSGAFREALNLSSNNANLGRRIKIYGTQEKYFSTRGLKSISDYVWLDALPDVQPSIPVVKIGEQELENDGSQTVEVDTEVTISCENATKLMVSINNDEYTEQDNPYTFNVTEDTYIKVYGINGTYKDEANVFSFNFDVNIEPENPGEANDGTYVLIKSLDELGDNAECLIVADGVYTTKASSVPYTRAMMPYSNGGNYFNSANVVISDETIVITDENVQEVTITKLEDGFYTLAIGESTYLAATGGTNNNYLKTAPNIDNTSKATITFDGINADIKFNLTANGSRNWLRFNYNNGSPIFNCYASTNTNMAPVQLYKKVVAPEVPEVQELTFVQVKDDDYIEVGATYAIVSGSNAMGRSNSNSSRFNSVAVELDGDSKTFTASSADVLFLTLEEIGGKALKTQNYDGPQGYLNPSADATSIDVAVEETTLPVFNLVKNGSNYTGNVNIGNDQRKIQYSSGYFGAYSSSTAIQLYKELKLGKIIYTLTGDKKVEDGPVTVDLGDVFTFKAENATDIKLSVAGENVEMTEDKGIYTWTVNDYYNGAVTVTPYRNGEDGIPLEFTIVMKQPVQPNPDVPKVGSRFKQLLNGDEVTEGIYVIARKENNAAMGVNAGSNGVINSTNKIKVETIDVWRPLIYEDKPANNQPYRTRPMSVITTQDIDVLIVEVEKNDDGQLGIRTLNWGDGSEEAQGYLYGPNESGATNLEISKDFVPAYFDITQYDNTNIRFTQGGSRSISANTGATSFNYVAGSNAVQLYKLTEAVQFYPDIERIVVPTDQERNITLKNPEETIPTNIKYGVKGTTSTVIWVEDRDGQWVVRANDNRGSERPSIIISWEESDGWFPGVYEVPVTVKYQLDDAAFGFRHAYVRGKVDVGVLSQAAYYTGPMPITYRVFVESQYKYKDPTQNTEPTNEVTIDANTGMIRPDDIKNAVIEREYLVEAYVGECDEHFEGRRTYIFKIEEPSGAIKSESFDFTVKGAYGMYDGFNTGNTSGEGNPYANTFEKDRPDNASPVDSFTEGDVMIKMGEGNYRLFEQENDGYQLRMHKGNTMTISSDKKITAVEFDYFRDYLNVEANSGGTYEKGIWNASDRGGVSSVTFTATDTYRLYEVKVTLAPEFSDKPQADLHFDVSDEDVNHYINFFEDEVVKLPELIAATGLKFEDLDFDIDEVSNDEDAKTDDSIEYVDYTIYNNGFKDIKVKVNDPGVYTLRVSYDGEKGDAQFLPGFAILRLNVFPHLDVLPENDEHLFDDERNKKYPSLTVVEGGSFEEGYEDCVTVKIPTIESLEKAYKYSTIKIVKVEIEEDGNTKGIYAGEGLAEIPETFDFKKDGRIIYTITYANTDAFTAETAVHIIHRPQVPTMTSDNYEYNKIYFAAKEGELVEYSYMLCPSAPYEQWINIEDPEPYFPTHSARSAARRAASASNTEETLEPGVWYYTDEDTALTLPNNGGVYGVKYRSIKDLSAAIDDEDTTLGSPFMVTILNTQDGMLTGTDSIEYEEYDPEAVYFTVQGLRVVRPEKGIYIKVKGNVSKKVVF